MDYRSPDGITPDQVNSSTAQSLLIPPRRAAVLYTHSDADWEQAGIIHVENHRLDDELGNYERLVILHLFAKDYPQSVVITGWHKQGPPSSELGWHPSWGTNGIDVFGHPFVGWKDTRRADAPYNDLHVTMILGPPVDLSSAYRVATSEITTERAYQMAHMLTYFSTLADAGATITRWAPRPEELIGRIIDRYLSQESIRREPVGDSGADLLVWQLVKRAHCLQAGSLRDRLMGLAQDVARRRESLYTETVAR